MPEYSFTIGELFPTDDVLGEFITVLAMISNDWLRLMDDLESEPDRPSDSVGRGVWNYRLQAALHYEAADFLRFAKRKPQIAEFIAAMEQEDQEDFQEVLGGAGDDPSSAHGVWFKNNRNRAFHYSNLGSGSPVRKALRGAADETGTINWEPRMGDRRFPFADQVSLEWLGPGEDYEAQLERMSQTITALARFCEAAISKYLVDKGVARRPEADA